MNNRSRLSRTASSYFPAQTSNLNFRNGASPTRDDEKTAVLVARDKQDAAREIIQENQSGMINLDTSILSLRVTAVHSNQKQTETHQDKNSPRGLSNIFQHKTSTSNIGGISTNDMLAAHYDDLMAKQRSLSKKKETVFIRMNKNPSSRLTFHDPGRDGEESKKKHPTPIRITNHKLEKTSPFRPPNHAFAHQSSNQSLLNATMTSIGT